MALEYIVKLPALASVIVKELIAAVLVCSPADKAKKASAALFSVTESLLVLFAFAEA